ncbi:hypothetical protein Salat_2481600 [Sesamum alatum]|uniref:Late embryogenesis abundant protein n=1 Tax=Sesamum alatum TaxID=300844 RepID=A0AAE1XRC5_9LAMI|nr:hypothetical protein Salat_2481600 [Sesamum alatum]
MLNALKLARAVQQPSLFSYPLQNHIARKPSATVRFVQATAEPKQPDSSDSMEQKQDPKSKTRDTMTSFGEGYATRSDEEGFGGIYGGNQYVAKDTDGKNATEFDQNQGSEVKEKEKARNQSKVASS